MNQNQQRKINEFSNNYLDYSYRRDWNSINISAADSYDHNRMVFEICYWLLKNKIPFLTQARFKTGHRPDIITPTHIKPIIEVRNTEKEKNSLNKLKLVPIELQKEIIYVDCFNLNKEIIEFNEKLIL